MERTVYVTGNDLNGLNLPANANGYNLIRVNATGFKVYDGKYSVWLGDLVQLMNGSYVYRERLGAKEELEKEKAKAINERKEAQKQKHYQLERRKNTVKLAAVLTAIPLAGAGVFAGINKVADKQPNASFVAHLSEIPDKGVALSDVNPLIAQEYLNYSLSQASEASRNSSYPQVQELYDRLYEYYAIPVYTAYYDYVDYQTMGLSVEQVAASLENYHTELNNYEGAITDFYGSIFSFGASPLIASIVKDGKVYVPDTGLKEPDEELDSDSFVINGTLYVPFKENKELRK